MKRFLLITALIITCANGVATSDPVRPVTQTPDTLACEIFRERPDWYAAAQQTEMRWGLPVSHQLALLTEEWTLEHGKVPTKWRPDWTRSERPLPGIKSGFFAKTWDQYRTQTGRNPASTNKIDDVLDFMGWYFATLAPRENISPYDPVAQYILWRHGPDDYRAGTWQSNLWLNSQANRFADRARLYMSDLEDCAVPKKEKEDRNLWQKVNVVKWRQKFYGRNH
jgi:hypothetical protein